MMLVSHTVLNATTGILADGESPSLKPGLDANQVSPGVIGFLLTLLLAVLIIFVALDHTRRQRRLKNRFDYAMAREQEEREAAEREAEAHGGRFGDASETRTASSAREVPAVDESVKDSPNDDAANGTGRGPRG